MDNQLSDTDSQILDLWEGMKPREAKSLKFIVMDESGTFAGQFTCDIDSHGDRYFLIKQAPKSGKWTLSSNLVANLEASEEELPKTAVKSREMYQDTVSKSIYRLDVDSSDQDNAAGQSEKEHSEVAESSVHEDDQIDVDNLFRQAEPIKIAEPYSPDDASDIVCFPPGKYFIGDPCYAIPKDLWLEYIDACEGEAIDMEGVGRSVYFSNQYEADDEGFGYPSDSGLIGVTCVDNLDIEQWKRLKQLGRLVQFDDGEDIARDEDGDECLGEWDEAFQTCRDRKGNIFLGWNWFYVDTEVSEEEEEEEICQESGDTNQGLEFVIITTSSIDPRQAMIYMWEIISSEDDSVLGRYIGKSSRGETRPLTHYARNVANLLAGKPYRKNNPEGYRRIHHALAEATACGHKVRLIYLENVGNEQNINEVERQFITKIGTTGSEKWQLND
jgi:hypothetical protein